MKTDTVTANTTLKLPDLDKVLDALGAWVLAIVWISPLLFAA